ncbi:MAG: hypothetical protein C0596_01090 [Marinilabiliales bacterium]|nr:MAG: hypothetical protein C0596_01090 [Marinilabiliales bacterium]
MAAYYFSEIQDMETAIPYYYNANKYAGQIGKLHEAADMMNFIGICYETIGMHDSAIICFNKFLELSKNADYELGIANAYKNMGLVYEYSGDYDNAIVNYIEASKISDKANDTIFLIDSYMNIGGVYRSIEQYEKADEYIKNALELNSIVEDKTMYARIYNQLAMLEKIHENYTQAIEYYELTLLYSKEIGWDTGIAAAYGNLGNVYFNLRDYQKALDYHHKSLEIEEELNHYYGIRISKNSLSSVYLKLGNFEEAEKYALEAYEMAKTENNYDGIAESVSYLFEISLINGDNESAQNYFNEYNICIDSVYSIESLEKIAEVDTKYQTEKRKQKIELLNIQNQLEKDKSQKQRFFIIILASILAVTVILTLIIWKFYIQKQKAYKALVKMNVQAVKCEQTKEEVIIQQTDKSINENSDLADKLLKYFIKEKPYLQSDFTIDKLAKALESNRQYISKTINECFSKNFSTFINEYRVKEARKLLIDPEYDKYTLEGIAECSGFSNRTSFISAFKKYTGVTPSYFKANSTDFEN